MLDDLPQLNLSEMRIPVAIPLRDPIHRPTPSVGMPIGNAGESPSPPTSESHASTPGTLKSFSGEDEAACGFFIPSRPCVSDQVTPPVMPTGPVLIAQVVPLQAPGCAAEKGCM